MNTEKSDETEVQSLPEAILDDVEALINLVYLLKDERSTPTDHKMYIKLADEKMNDLRDIVRRQLWTNRSRMKSRVDLL